MFDEAPPHPPAVRPTPPPLVAAFLGAVAGSLLTPVTVLFLGWLALGRGPGWSADQGDGFAATIYAFYSALPGAVFGGVAATVLARTRDARARWARARVALALFAVLLAACLGALLMAAG
jgi:hypothetical protein